MPYARVRSCKSVKRGGMKTQEPPGTASNVMPLRQAHRSATPACWVAAQSKGPTNLLDKVNQKEKPRGDQITSMGQIPNVPEAHG